MSDNEWQVLIHALRDGDPAESAAAATRLHKTATAQDVARLMDLLNDDNLFVREAAAWPIAEFAGPSVLRELLVAYQRGFDDGHDN
jgi:HEAT repeat protein